MWVETLNKLRQKHIKQYGQNIPWTSYIPNAKELADIEPDETTIDLWKRTEYTVEKIFNYLYNKPNFDLNNSYQDYIIDAPNNEISIFFEDFVVKTGYPGTLAMVQRTNSELKIIFHEDVTNVNADQKEWEELKSTYVKIFFEQSKYQYLQSEQINTLNKFHSDILGIQKLCQKN